MKNVGTDTFTSNTEGKWLDDGKTFVQYYDTNEVRKFTNVTEYTGTVLEVFLEENGFSGNDGTKFYFSPLVYSYTRVEWDAELEGR